MSKVRGLPSPDEDFRFAGALIYGADRPEMKVPPQHLKKEHLVYLDELRDSGVTNMYCAAPYLQREFALTEKKALCVLCHWMATFEDRHPRKK